MSSKLSHSCTQECILIGYSKILQEHVFCILN
jgi:hypothetical protein